MVFSFRKFKRRFTFIVQLFLLTLLFYYSLNLITRWVEPVEKYRMPSGHSLKVFQEEMLVEQRQTIRDRLAMFYRMGE